MEKEGNAKINKRVGTFTFGITMVLFGICVFLQTFIKFDLLRYLLMIWPTVFIILGAETLFYVFKKETNIKYDIFSVFMIFVILFVGGIFSVANYGINKVLYSDEIKNAIVENLNTNYNFEFDNKVDITNVSGKKIEYNTIEVSDNESTRMNVQIKYKVNDSNNFISSIFNRDWFYNYFNIDYNTGKVVITDIPEYVESIKIIIYTKDPSKITHIDK